MRFLNVVHDGRKKLAMRIEGGIVTLDELQRITGRRYGNARCTDDIIRMPRVGSEVTSDLKMHLNKLQGNMKDENDVKFLPCVTRPGKVVCIGLNYRKHANEVGATLPEVPVIFSKFSDSVAGHLTFPRRGARFFIYLRRYRAVGEDCLCPAIAGHRGDAQYGAARNLPRCQGKDGACRQLLAAGAHCVSVAGADAPRRGNSRLV